MIEYYDAGTTEFDVGGTLIPQAYEAKITHVRNGNFDLEFKYPLTGDKYKDFKKHTVYYADVPYLGKQAFYQSSIKKGKDHVMVYAKHVGFLLDKNIVKDIKSTSVIGSTILSRFNAALQIPHNYTFSTDITESRQFNQPGYNNALKVLAEGKHSILGQWGGVLVMDNWDISLKKRWGRDTEYLIAKRKNVNDISIDENNEDIVTRLFLTKRQENQDTGKESVVEVTVDSPLINEYPVVYGEARETEDQSVVTEADLIKYGEDIFRLQRIDLPKESFIIDATNDINEYEFTVDDTALVYYEDYELYKRVSVESYEYDPMEHKYIKVNFGDRPKSMLQETSDKIADTVGKDIIESNKDYIAGIIEEISKGLKDPTGGNIIIRKDNEGNPIELLITDNKDLDQAMNIWRWNIQGLSHSSNGIHGDFDVAITQDGQVMADFITAGVLNAALIKTGLLQDFTGKTWIDMDTGFFNLAGMVYNENGLSITLDGEDLSQSIRSKVSNTEYQGDKSVIEQGIVDAERIAKEYAEQQAQAAENAAKAQSILDKNEAVAEAAQDATDKARAAEEAAELFAAQVAEAEKELAQIYSDGLISEEETKRINAIEAGVEEARLHAIEKANEAREQAKEYANQQDAALQIGGRNLMQISNIEELGLETTVVSGSQYRGFSIPVTSGHKYMLSRKETSTPSRFRYAFTTAKPVNGTPFFGGNTDGTIAEALIEHKIEAPQGASYIFVYLSNTGEDITNDMEIQLERGTKVTGWQPAPEDVAAEALRQATITLDTAKADAKEKADAAREAAKTYAEVQAKAEADLAKQESHVYADDKMEAERLARVQAIKDNLEAARLDAEDKASAAEQAAKDYADAQDALLKIGVDDKINEDVENVLVSVRENEVIMGEFADRIQNTITQETLDIYIDGTVQQIEKLEQDFVSTAESWDLRFSKTSGNNKLRNSVGYAIEEGKLTHWSTSGTINTEQSEELEGLGSGSAILIGSYAHIEQSFPVEIGKKYTLSYRYKMDEVAPMVRTNILIYDVEGTTRRVNVSEWEDGYYGDNQWKTYIITFEANTAEVALRIANTVGTSKVTNIMVNEGDINHNWTPYPKELYTTNFQSDADGFRVLRIEGGREVGYTEMTPEKFAGYHEGTKVFEMNKEVFEMSNAKVENEIQIGQFRFVAMGGGIGIVPVTE